MEAGPEFSMLGGAGEDIELGHPLDWKEALRLTLGEGLSEPASEEEVVWLEELRDSTLQDDMSKDLGREVFMRTRRSNVDTLKRKISAVEWASFGKSIQLKKLGKLRSFTFNQYSILL